MDRRLSTAVFLLAIMALGCQAKEKVDLYSSRTNKSEAVGKEDIAKAWLVDLSKYGENLVNPEIHSEYALPQLVPILPRLKKDIKQFEDALASSRSLEPEIITINGEVENGFAAKYEDILLAFGLIGSDYVLVDIDPIKVTNP